VLIFGGSGQLGGELLSCFAQARWQVVPLRRQEADLNDLAKVVEKISVYRPNVVINAAAYGQVDLAERDPDQALLTNASAIRNLAQACSASGAKLFHYSTDYVFDGLADRPYRESDPVHPINTYGVSKLAGEYFIRAYAPHALILRVGGIFGPRGILTNRGNFVETMLRAARDPQPVRVIVDFTASPTYAPALAQRTFEIVERDLSGTYHCGGGEAVTWYDFAQRIFEVAGVQAQLVPASESDYQISARRPKYSALSNAKLENAGISAMPSLIDALKDYMRRRSALRSSTHEALA
jgi:dTDP-4-dehydrorhamnose reductase